MLILRDSKTVFPSWITCSAVKGNVTLLTSITISVSKMDESSLRFPRKHV